MRDFFLVDSLLLESTEELFLLFLFWEGGGGERPIIGPNFREEGGEG